MRFFPAGKKNSVARKLGFSLPYKHRKENMTTKRRQTRERIQSILDEYGALATLAHEKQLCDALADAAIDVLVKKPRRKSQPPQKNREMYHLARAIGDVCRMSYKANTGRLFAEAKRLASAEPTPTAELVRKYYGQGGTWYTTDWRGKQGNIPTPGQIRSTWLQLAEIETRRLEFTV